ncbi:MAG: hypothetical protein B6I30_08445 [Desulfobacteraceae bacterium 4572_187]|nr:MAG: hypothetical protein B6I30_08445 [Desulfobacteraceae bacterium 4572_187]
MKKYLLSALLLIFFMPGILYSQNLVVTSPNAAAQWVKSRDYVITWDKSGEIDIQVKIILFRADKEVLIITDSTDNDGAHSWTVPSDLIPGRYTIKVITTDNSVSDLSDDFSVKSAPVFKRISPAVTGTLQKLPPYLKIVSPNGGEDLTVGTDREITWECAGLSGNVNLMLFKKNKEGRTIQIVNLARNVTVTSRSYMWRVGKHASGTVRPYKMFSVEIQTPDRKYRDESDHTFAIVYPSGKAISKPTPEGEAINASQQPQSSGEQAGGTSTEGLNLGQAPSESGDTGSTAREAVAPTYVSPIPDLRCRIDEVKLKTGPLPFGAVLRKATIRFSLRYDTSGEEASAPRFMIRTLLIDKKLNKAIKSKEGMVVTLPSNKWDSRFSKVYKKLMKGPYTFTIILDPENEVRESNENNNRREKQFRFNK